MADGHAAALCLGTEISLIFFPYPPPVLPTMQEGNDLVQLVIHFGW